MGGIIEGPWPDNHAIEHMEIRIGRTDRVVCSVDH